MLIGALILGADAMYALALTRGLLSVVAVLSSLYPVVTVALAHRYLNERIERRQLRGIAVAFEAPPRSRSPRRPSRPALWRTKIAASVSGIMATTTHCATGRRRRRPATSGCRVAGRR